MATDWTLSYSGPDSGSGRHGSPDVTFVTVTPGTYTLSEDGDPSVEGDYELTDLSCTGGTLSGDQLELQAGDNAVCFFTNDDVAPGPDAPPAP